MPSFKYDESEHKPRLKLEVIRGGSDSGNRTAVATHDGDDEPDWETQDAPWWFNLIFPFVRHYVRAYVKSLDIESRSIFLRRAKVPCFYWIFVDRQLEEAAAALEDQP
jgi:hypothetical protein